MDTADTARMSLNLRHAAGVLSALGLLAVAVFALIMLTPGTAHASSSPPPPQPTTNYVYINLGPSPRPADARPPSAQQVCSWAGGAIWNGWSWSTGSTFTPAVARSGLMVGQGASAWDARSYSASGQCYTPLTGSDSRSFVPGNWSTQGGTSGPGSAYSGQPMAGMGGPSLSYTGTPATNASSCATNAVSDPALKWTGYSVQWNYKRVFATTVWTRAWATTYTAPGWSYSTYNAGTLTTTIYIYYYTPSAPYVGGWDRGSSGGTYNQYTGGYTYRCIAPPAGNWVYPACFSHFNMTRLGYFWQRKSSGVPIPPEEFTADTGRKPGQGVGSATYTTDSGLLGWEQTTYGSTRRYSDCANGGNFRYRYLSAAAQQARRLAEYGRYEFYKTGRYDIWKRYRFTQADWRTGGVPGDIDRGIIQSGLTTTGNVAGQEQPVTWQERWQMFCWKNPSTGIRVDNATDPSWADQPPGYPFSPSFTTRDCADVRTTPVWTCALDARASVQYPWRPSGVWFNGIRPSSPAVRVGADGRPVVYRWKRPDPKNATGFQGIRNISDRFFSVVPVVNADTVSSPWLRGTTSPNATGQPFSALPKFRTPLAGWLGATLSDPSNAADTAHTYSSMRFYAPSTPGKEFAWHPEWTFTAEFQVGTVSIDYSDTNGNEGTSVTGGNWQRLPAVCNVASPPQWSGDTTTPAGTKLTGRAQALSVRNIPDPWIE